MLNKTLQQNTTTKHYNKTLQQNTTTKHYNKKGFSKTTPTVSVITNYHLNAIVYLFTGFPAIQKLKTSLH
jgi:uncharacterized membrane protein